MPRSVRKPVPDTDHEYRALFPGDRVLAFARGLVGIAVQQFLRRDEEDLLREDLFNIIILDRHEFFGLLDRLIDAPDGLLQRFDRALLLGDDAFPVPLIDVDRMDVVGRFVAPDRVHVRVKPLVQRKSVLPERHALPFGERLHDFHRALVLLLDAEPDRPFDAVQVVVQTRFGRDKQRSGNALQIELLRERALEKVLDGFDRNLRIVQRQRRTVAGIVKCSMGNSFCFSLCRQHSTPGRVLQEKTQDHIFFTGRRSGLASMPHFR